MIDARRAQFNFGDKLIADEVDGLYEEWMIHVDQVLADEKIVAAAYEALAKRRLLSRTRGRRGFAAEVVVRLLIPKHIRNWSYAILEREVRANLIYRKFTRIGFAKMADAKTMGRWGKAVGPEVIRAIHERIVVSLPQIRSGRTGGGDHRESASEESGRRHELHVIPEHLCLTTDVFALHCNSSCTIATRDEGAALRRPRYDRPIPVGSTRSPVRHRHFCHGDRGEVGRSRIPMARMRRVKA